MSNKQINLSLEPVLFDELIKNTNNIYDSVNIISAWAKELSSRDKVALDQLLIEYGSPSGNEDLSHLEECEAICNSFDSQPKAHIRAINDFMNDELFLAKNDDSKTSNK